MQNASVPSNPLATEKISKLLLKFSIPTIMTLLVNYLYNIVDQIFVGQGIGIAGIAATNIAFPFTTISIALALLIGDGCSANISLFLGKGQQEQADKAFGNAISLLLGCGLVIIFFSLLFLKPLVLLFGASPTVLQPSMDYSRIIVLGLPFMMCNVAFTAIIRADGNPKYMMKCMMLGAAINLVLDPVFIFVLDMGITGAAAATVLGQIVSGTVSLMYIPRFHSIHYRKENLKPDFSACKRIFTLGFPSLMTQLSNALTQIIMNNLMRKYGAVTVYGSDIALSAYGMMMKVYQVAHAMFVGVSAGTQPINGFNFGAKQYGRVKATYKTASSISIVLSVLWFLIFQCFSGLIARLFIKDNPLYYEFAVHAFHLYLAAFFVYGFPMVTASFFQAVGMPAKALLISLSRQILFLIPFALLLSKLYGLDGALYASPIADILTFSVAFCTIFLELRKWKRQGML